MISLIGNAPSSGSTFFADLLDSTPASACGPEINIFSTTRLYKFDTFKTNPWAKSISAVYLNRETINPNALHFYGLSKPYLENIIKESGSLSQFVDAFVLRFLAFRGKDTNGILYEKTPQNMLCLKQFLDAFPDNYFIFIVRNPLFVFDSLKKRGYTGYISLLSWYLEALKYYKYKDHPRVLLIRYEDLVKEPFKVASNAIQTTSGFRISPDKLQYNYSNNLYRKYFSIRLKSWQTQEIGRVRDCNNKCISPEIEKEFQGLLPMVVNHEYAKIFDLDTTQLTDLIKYFGYDHLLSNTGTPIAVKKGAADILRLFKRFLLAISTKDAQPHHVNTYLNPLLKTN